MSKVRSRIQKGRNFQKRICEKFKETFGLTDEDLRCPIGSEIGSDLVKISKRAKELICLEIEMKNQKNMNIWSAIEQAKARKKGKDEEAVIFKRGTLGANKEYICVPLDHYLSLRKENMKDEP